MNKKLISVGDEAPDFTLKNTHNEDVTLSNFEGDKNIFLVFNRGFS